MRYEVRVDGKAAARFETPEEAEAHVRHILQHRADARCEAYDTETGKGLAPAATREHQEYLATKVGF